MDLRALIGTVYGISEGSFRGRINGALRMN